MTTISAKEAKKLIRDGAAAVFNGDDGDTFIVGIDDFDELSPGKVVIAGPDGSEFIASIRRKPALSNDPNIAAARISEAAITGLKDLVRSQQDMIDRQVQLVERLTELNKNLLTRVNEDNWSEVVTALAPNIPILVPVIQEIFSGIGKAMAAAAERQRGNSLS